MGRVDSIPHKWAVIWFFAFGTGNLFFVALLRFLSAIQYHEHTHTFKLAGTPAL